MCGIAGGVVFESAVESSDRCQRMIVFLAKRSQLRGQDATGIAKIDHDSTEILKEPITAGQLLASSAYKSFIAQLSHTKQPLRFLIHTRLATNGNPADQQTNQPFVLNYIVGAHNGIVTNYDHFKSDSLQFFEQLDNLAGSCDPKNLISATKNTFATSDGAISIAMFSKNAKCALLASNTGSMFYIFCKKLKYIFFASEKNTLTSLIRKFKLRDQENKEPVTVYQVQAHKGVLFDIVNFELIEFSLDSNQVTSAAPVNIYRRTDKPIFVRFDNFIEQEKIANLRRCKKCILPETYPLISFDSIGVCNFCSRYQKQIVHGEAALLKYLDPFRSKNGSVDCLVGLSGGRDSSYGLHLLKTKYGMNPVAYTFDWGLTTEVSRRNQSIMCGRLGVEHIIRAANLDQKRSYARKNVDAFLHRPHLGMVPLFMAGDKEFYELGRTLRNELNLNLTIFCAGHALEQRDFMTGFCGVDETITNNKRLFQFRMWNKLRLSLFYLSQYVVNPRYINSSLYQSIRAYFYSFIFKDDFLYLYEFIPWDEKHIESVLFEHYGWESDIQYGKNQWRMGDGQTALTNLIYYKMAGFSEFDNFRSNQIRQGLLDRNEALKLVEQDNQPKLEQLRYFCESVNIDIKHLIEKVRQFETLY